MTTNLNQKFSISAKLFHIITINQLTSANISTGIQATNLSSKGGFLILFCLEVIPVSTSS